MCMIFKNTLMEKRFWQ